jgi:MYXO-CTERM domain-containing protein
MKKVIVSLVALSGIAAVANAQTPPMEPIGASLRFEAWNGMEWTRNLVTVPGARVEIRAVVNYTGTRTDLTAMGEILYQPILSNADNTGGSTDNFGPFRNGGISGNGIPGSLLTEAEGNNSGALADYGRVRFGQTAMNTANQNVMTQFRHSGGSNGAPAGEWIRLAGSFVSQWPAATLPAAPGADGLNRITRGVSANQVSRALTNPQTNHTLGTSNLVIFRMALTLGDGTDTRTLTSSPSFLKRAGGTTSTDDTRYMTWQAGDSDNGSVRVGVEFQDLTISVPTPASMALLGLGGLVAARRRRA